jgi:pantetheine-phosphate adenylyltransferase
MIERGCRIVDELVVAIGINPDKKYLFTLEQRLDMLRETTAAFANVKVTSYENMFLVNYARLIDASFILRGIRNEQDYSYERGMRYVNAELGGDITTIFLIPPRELVEVSSSFVKGLVGPDGWEEVLKKYVPPAVHRQLMRIHHGR